MPVAPPGKRVLLVGDHDDRDFRDVVVWLEQHTVLARVDAVPAALDHLRGHLPPHVLIVAQARPGRFAGRQVERLHAVSPLSRLVALLGTWCEGEERSGRPWPGVLRVFWHQWDARMIPELSGTDFPRSALCTLPRTTSFAEHAAQAAGAPPSSLRQGLVAVHTPSAQTYRGLSDACRGAGYATAWSPPSQPPQLSGVEALLWDAIACDTASAAELWRLSRAVGTGRVIALLDFVRRGDCDRALAAGAGAVLAKPFLVGDLLWHLERVLSGRCA